jgi:hypothetical protein
VTDLNAAVGLRILAPRANLLGVHDPDSLVNVDTNILPNGCSVWVNSSLAEFRLRKTDNSTPPDNINIVAPISGPGRWFINSGSVGPGGGIQVQDQVGLTLPPRPIVNSGGLHPVDTGVSAVLLNGEIDVLAFASLATAASLNPGFVLRLLNTTYALDGDITDPTTKLAFKQSSVLTVGANRTLASEVTMTEGGLIVVGAGATLTQTGPIHAPDKAQLWDVSALGSAVVLGAGAISHVTPEMFGGDLVKATATAALAGIPLLIPGGLDQGPGPIVLSSNIDPHSGTGSLIGTGAVTFSGGVGPYNTVPVTTFGAVGDSGLTDNHPMIQRGLDALARSGGARLHVPGMQGGKYYGITRPCWVGHNTQVTGDGPSSWIHNYFNGTSTLANEGVVFMFSGYEPGGSDFYGEPAYNIDDVAPGSTTIKCQTPADAANLPVGSIVWVCSAQTNMATGQPLPLQNAMNEVVASDPGTGLVTLQYAIDDPITSYLGTPAIVRVSTNTIVHPSGRTCQIIKRATIENLKLTQIPGHVWGIFTSGGVWQCTLRNLELDGEVGVSWNWVGRTLIENLKCRLTRKMFDVAVGSIGSTFRNITASYWNGPNGLGGQQIHIAHGERTRDCVFDGVHCVSALPLQIASITAKRAVIKNSLFSVPASLDNVNGMFTLTQDDPTVHAENCLVENNRFRSPVLNEPVLTIQAKPTADHRNVVRANKLETPINKAVPTLDVRNNGSDVLFENNELPNGWIRSVNGVVIPHVELRGNVTRQFLMVREDHTSAFVSYSGTPALTEFTIYTAEASALPELAPSDNINQSMVLTIVGTYGGTGAMTLRIYDQSNVLQAFFPGITGTLGGAQVWHLTIYVFFRIGNSQFVTAELDYNGTTYTAHAFGQAVDMTATDYSLDVRAIMTSDSGGDAIAVRSIELEAQPGNYQTAGNPHSNGAISSDSSTFTMVLYP